MLDSEFTSRAAHVDTKVNQCEVWLKERFKVHIMVLASATGWMRCPRSKVRNGIEHRWDEEETSPVLHALRLKEIYGNVVNRQFEAQEPRHIHLYIISI